DDAGEHQDAGDGKDDVEQVLVAVGLVGGGHMRPQAACDVAGAEQQAAGVQMLKKNSGMLTMYFRFNVQRSTILMGSAAMNWIRFTRRKKRTKPIFTKKLRITVLAKSGGSASR